MKIALVSANNFKNPYPIYPLGVSYIVTYLNTYLPECEVSLFDFNLGDYDDFSNFLSSQDFNVVGISLRNIDDTNIFDKNCFIAHYKVVMEHARKATNAPIVIGGPGFSVYPELVFNELQPDYAIAGEGEESFLKLITAIESGSPDILKIEGLVYKDLTGKIVINGKHSHISSPKLHINDTLAEYYWPKSGMLNIQTKRGCPYKCIYCSYPNIDGVKVRTLDAKTVVSNIEELYYQKGITYLFFTDSIFNIHNEYNRELAHRIIESKVKINWGAYFSPHNLPYEDLELYQKSGLTHIEFGTDSFSDSQLENYCKRFRFADIKQKSLECSQLGIFYAHFLILCGYGETEASLNETFEHSKEVGLTVIFPYIGMRIYPNTRLCEIALKENIIKDCNELINPTYYVSAQTDISTLEQRAMATGVKWIFPNNANSPAMEILRARKRRGPLWEYLRY